MSHTPGPWAYTFSFENGEGFALTGADGTSVINGCGCCGSPFMDGPYAENARLMGAAPDLLKALILFQQEGIARGFGFAIADEAIAKATKETKD